MCVIDCRSGLSLLLVIALVAGSIVSAAASAWAEPQPHGVGLFDPATGRWEIRSLIGQQVSFYFGVPGDYPVIGDWDCDGDETPGVYRQADASVHLSNATGTAIADVTYSYGLPGDIPLAGDFNGDGCDTVSVYRASSGQVFIVNRLGSGGLPLGAADLSYWFGISGDRPFVGDFSGDGIDTLGVQRVAATTIYLRHSQTTGFADASAFFSDAGDRFVAGDWRAEGVDLLAFYRAAETTFHFVEIEVPFPPHPDIVFGEPGWLPVAGDFELPPLPTVVLPNLIGMTRVEADQVMNDLALATGVFVSLVTEFVVSHEEAWTKIVVTRPPPGSEVAAFSEVTIVVGMPAGP